jgi:ribosomal protein S18 acetylase RimI-like enzyme
VVEDPDAGKVVGYILGTLDTRQQEARLKRIMLHKIQTYWRKLKPKNLTQFRAYLLIRASLRTPYAEMLSTYPAHLHINIHPNYQRNGLGSLLLEAYEQNLIQKSVAGYHLGVYGKNQVGISFYEKKGLTRLRQLPRIGKPYVIFFGRKLK